MSYYNQGPPPPGQPPYQQSHSPYPQQGGYPPQPPHPQQNYNQSYNQGPPMNQQYQQQGYQQGWNQPPQQQPFGAGSPYPPQPGAYAPPPGPPPGQFSQGQPGQQWGQGQGQGPPNQFNQAPPPGPPPGQYGAPPGNYGSGPSAPPSMGYVPGQQANTDMSRAADEVRSAMKGFGTNERALISVLAKLDPLQVNSVKAAFQARHHRDLLKDVHGETSGYFRDGLEAMIRGPLEQDCFVLNNAIKGLGTKESAMNEVLLARSNADINAIKQHYQKLYRRSLESDVKGDLSMKTERLFDIVMAARRNDESAPAAPPEIDRDVQELYRATEGRTGADQISVCQIMATRSNGQIRAISAAYKQKYHRSLENVLQGEFSGHMEQALVFILRRGEDAAKHDADLLEEAMKGMGTKDVALVRRVVAVHWDQQRLHQCKAAYKHFYKQELSQRIAGETSNDYQKLMVACVS